MEDMEQKIESTPKKKGIRNFWKGALCGALFSLVICTIVMLAIGVFKKQVYSGELVSAQTELKLRNIRSIIEEIYL